jgi:branched-chain amino acid transport system substrate-binding protein
MRYVIAFAASLVFASGLSAAQAETGVSSNAIAFGQSAEPQGPASALGLAMRDGLPAAFGEASRQCGVHGHQIRLISDDDGYEPSKLIAVARKLIKDDKVFALIGPVGTPIAVAAQPTAAAAQVPCIAASTGTRNPKRDAVIDSRASCDAETGGASDMGGGTMTSRTARSRRSTA